MGRDRHEYMREYQKKWLAKRRLKAIETLGGECSWCGSTDRLEIDHIKPTRTEGYRSPGGGMWSWSWERILAELEKCWLLCHECHRVKTRDDLPDTLHGTASMWHHHKCRCQVCRDWMAASKRDYRARKRSQLAMAQLGSALPSGGRDSQFKSE